MKRLIEAVPADAAAVREMLFALRGRYGFLNIVPIGQSVCGRDILGVTVGGGGERVLYAAAFHAQEWITSLLVLRLCEEICGALSADGRIADMDLAQALAGRCLVLVPQVNPDGVEIALHGPGTAGEYAGAVRERGGEIPGLWQANARGVDINHNFDAGWTLLREQEQAAGICGPAPRQYGGAAPGSEPETAALVSLCGRAGFRHVIALHTQGEEIYWQYGEHTPPYARMMAEIMAVSSGYTVTQPEGLASHGGFKDWFIDRFRRPGFTVEAGRGVNPLPLSDFEAIYAKSREMLLLAALM